jgi:hypothetical protein
MQIGRWLATWDGVDLHVGCQRHSLNQWHEKIHEIAEENDATEKEVALVLAMLSLAEDFK